MDSLFERRNLKKNVHIGSKYLQKNIGTSILAQLKMSFEGQCSSEGYIQPGITIINYSLGRTNYIHGGVDYSVEFQADVCRPHTGQKFRAPIKLRSKIGIHAELSPLKILIPRDLHLGNTEYDECKIGEEIEFEIMGPPQFKPKDKDIIIIGKLLSKTPETVELPLLSVPDTTPVLEPHVEDNPDEMKVVIKMEEKPKTRRLRRTVNEETNAIHNDTKTVDE